jgi:hypothetical protein
MEKNMEKINKKFLKYEMDEYLGGQSALMKTENQQYIHTQQSERYYVLLKELVVNLKLIKPREI